MKKISKLSLVVALGVLPFISANAAGVVQVGNGLYVPNYTSQELRVAGCDQANWNVLVNNYVTKRTNERLIEKSQTDQYIQQAPSAQGLNIAGGAGACFQNAIGSINNTISQVNQVLSIFSGGFDLGSLASNIGNQFANAACQQVNYYTGQQVSRVTGAVSSNIYQGQNAVNGTVNTTLGNTGLNGINGMGAVNGALVPNNGNNIPYVGTPGINGAANNTGSIFNRINPFRTNDQQVPDAIR